MRYFTLLLLIFVINGCDIFRTREPENPVQTRNTWIPATTIEILLDNLKSALSERSTENYLRCFVDSSLTGKSFEFLPTAESYANYSVIFSNWKLQNERVYFENMKSKLRDAGGITLSLFNEERGTIQSDSVSFLADYLLIVDHSIENLPKEFKGHLQFTLYRDVKGEWSILRWKDNKKDENLTWSDLKGRFSY
ncbi:MAG: hypothetical protein WHV63_05945 [Ignavibacteria bacterium]